MIRHPGGLPMRILSASLVFLAVAFDDLAHDIQWVHLSSKNGDLPVPGTSAQQTGALAVRVEPAGFTDFILSFRKVPPALVWYRRGANGWTRYVIEKEFLSVEAGGAAYDIDGDG